MSPVSRGRKSKKAKRGGKRPERAPGSGRVNAAELGLNGLRFAEPGSPLDALLGSRDEPEWWQSAHERVIDASGSLLALHGPRELEQATAELIGAELYDAMRDDPVTSAVLTLLPEWVRWNGEQAGVPAPLIERAVSAASREIRRRERIGNAVQGSASMNGG